MRVTDDRNTVKEALQFALEYTQAPKKWVRDAESAGPAVYDRWIWMLGQDKPDGNHLSYQGQCWAECRYYAVSFLEEAADRLGGEAARALREAKAEYAEVSERMNTVSELIPFHSRKPEHLEDAERIRDTIVQLRAAQAAETRGLDRLHAAYGLL